MKNSSVNIKFSYLYRSAGNYKQFGSVVLSNSTRLNLRKIEQVIKRSLIDTEYFYAEKWGLPVLFDEYFDPQTDPLWHEFECLTETTDPADFELELLLTLISETSQV